MNEEFYSILIRLLDPSGAVVGEETGFFIFSTRVPIGGRISVSSLAVLKGNTTIASVAPNGRRRFVNGSLLRYPNRQAWESSMETMEGVEI